ncbi:hypothetical protein D3C72_2305170 [compost metagenome]
MALTLLESRMLRLARDSWLANVWVPSVTFQPAFHAGPFLCKETVPLWVMA